jgi:hypothetical protein
MLPSMSDLGEGRMRYFIKPTTPTVLKIEKTTDNTIISGLPGGTVMIRDNPALDRPIEKMSSLPTRMNIMRFVQNL